jgi:glycerol-3-phosphate dehydrogenase
LRFVLPHHQGLRPWPLLRLGLFLYDHLGGRNVLPPTRSVDLTRDITGTPLKSDFKRGFEYSDCWVDDARMVVLNARAAADKGASIRPRTKAVKARRENNLWHVTLQDAATGALSQVTARGLVNTGGPWVSDVLGQVVGMNAPDRIRLVKGSHIVVDRLYDHEQCYIFQNADGRICFAIPYERDFTLIGTTDEDYSGDPANPAISTAERDYLLTSVSAYLKLPVTKDMVRWTYSGIRPLYDDGASKAQEATRDYVLKLDAPGNATPLISVFGGKITTFRRLAEAVLDKLAPYFPHMRGAWTATASMPGGEFPFSETAARIGDFARRHPFLSAVNATRMFRAYGTRADTILGDAKSAQDLGASFGLLSEREVSYLIDQEWAQEADDILWRRSKLGLHLTSEEQAALRDHLAHRHAPASLRLSTG